MAMLRSLVVLFILFPTQLWAEDKFATLNELERVIRENLVAIGNNAEKCHPHPLNFKAGLKKVESTLANARISIACSYVRGRGCENANPILYAENEVRVLSNNLNPNSGDAKDLIAKLSAPNCGMIEQLKTAMEKGKEFNSEFFRLFNNKPRVPADGVQSFDLKPIKHVPVAPKVAA